MPRGRPRKNTIEESKPEPELQKAIEAPVIDITPEKPTRKKTVTQVAKWTEEEPIDLEDETDDDDDLPAEFEEDSEQTAVFDDFLQPGADGRFIKVWKLPTYKRDGKTALRSTNRQFCDDLPVTPDYMQIIKNTWGAGVYQLELRDEYNRIVKGSRRMTIEIAGPQVQPVAQIQTLPNGQQIPIVIEQSQPQNPQAPVDPIKQFRQTLSLVREFKDDFREMMGLPERQENSQTQAPVSPKVAALELITENPEVMEKIGRGLTSIVSGGKNDHETSWADVGMELVRTGQAPQVAANIIREFMAPFSALWGKDNGTSQMVQTPIQNQEIPTAGQHSNTLPQQQKELAGHPSATLRHMGQDVLQDPAISSQTTPEIQALKLLLDHCAAKLPPKVAAERLLAYEKKVEEVAPEYSISGYIDLLVHLDPDAAFAITNQALPGSEAVTSLPHSREWFIELQANLKGNQDGSENDET
jgi:hypothetical protein